MTRKVFLILGRTGEGKSTLARKIRSKFNRVITFDPHFEYDGEIISTFREFHEYFIPLFDEWEEQEFNVVCRFSTDEDIEAALHYVTALSGVLLVIEETELYLDPKNPNKDIIWIIRHGRHRAISLLGIARRSMELNISLRSEATSIYTYRQIEERDLQVIGAYGFDTEIVRNLEPHRCVFIGEDFLEGKENEYQKASTP